MYQRRAKSVSRPLETNDTPPTPTPPPPPGGCACSTWARRDVASTREYMTDSATHAPGHQPPGPDAAVPSTPLPPPLPPLSEGGGDLFLSFRTYTPINVTTASAGNWAHRTRTYWDQFFPPLGGRHSVLAHPPPPSPRLIPQTAQKNTLPLPLDRRWQASPAKSSLLPPRRAKRSPHHKHANYERHP